ncbi:hypothetical protein [Rhizobium leguminosarum]|uniref:hypothetical protein n=1 Tax=Rhizobium leguminosarum TaxID=384 RepID=UPI003D00575D
MAFSIKKTFTKWESDFSHMMLVYPAERGIDWPSRICHNHLAHAGWGQALWHHFRADFKLDFRPDRAAIVFSIARNHLICMTYGKMPPVSAASLPKTNHTGLLSEAKADCLGKSTSSSASG